MDSIFAASKQQRLVVAPVPCAFEFKGAKHTEKTLKDYCPVVATLVVSFVNITPLLLWDSSSHLPLQQALCCRRLQHKQTMTVAIRRKSPLDSFINELQYEGWEFTIVEDNAKTLPAHLSLSPTAQLELLKNHHPNAIGDPLSSPRPCRWGECPSSKNDSSPTGAFSPTVMRKSRWDEAMSSGCSSLPLSSPSRPSRLSSSSSSRNNSSPTPPRRLPEHTDSFRILQRKYQRRCGIIMPFSPQEILTFSDKYGINDDDSDSSTHVLDPTSQRIYRINAPQYHNDSSGSLSKATHAIAEVGAECSASPTRGGIVRIPESLRQLPNVTGIEDCVDCSETAAKTEIIEAQKQQEKQLRTTSLAIDDALEASSLMVVSVNTPKQSVL